MQIYFEPLFDECLLMISYGESASPVFQKLTCSCWIIVAVFLADWHVSCWHCYIEAMWLNCCPTAGTELFVNAVSMHQNHFKYHNWLRAITELILVFEATILKWTRTLCIEQKFIAQSCNNFGRAVEIILGEFFISGKISCYMHNFKPTTLHFVKFYFHSFTLLHYIG